MKYHTVAAVVCADVVIVSYVKKYAISSSILLASSSARLSILADAGGLLRIIKRLPVCVVRTREINLTN